MEQIGLRGHKEIHARDVTHRCMPQISICRSPETEPPEPLETRTLVVRRIFDEGQDRMPRDFGPMQDQAEAWRRPKSSSPGCFGIRTLHFSDIFPECRKIGLPMLYRCRFWRRRLASPWRAPLYRGGARARSVI